MKLTPDATLVAAPGVTRRIVAYAVTLAAVVAALAVWLLMHSERASATTPASAIPRASAITPASAITRASGIKPASVITPDTGPGCTRYWMGWTSTDWHVTGNWSSVDGGFGGAALPGAGDVVCMATAPIRADVALTGAGVTVGGVQFAATGGVSPTLSVTSSTLTINGSAATSVINGLSLAQGTLNGSQDVQLTGAAQVTNAGAFYGSGVKTVVSGATLSLPTELTLGSPSCSDAAHLDIAGTVTLAETGIQMCPADAAGTRTTLVIDGTMNMQVGAFVSSLGGKPLLPYVINNGHIVGSNGGVVENAIAGVAFANRGTLDTGNGFFSVDGCVNPPSLPDTGAYVAGTGVFNVLGGTREFSGGSVSGEVRAYSADLTFDSDYSFSKLDLISSSVVGNSTLGVGALVTDRSSATAPASRIGVAGVSAASADFSGLELLPFTSLALSGPSFIETGGGDVTMDSNARIDLYGDLTIQGPPGAAIRSTAPLTTTVATDAPVLITVNTSFMIAPDMFYMNDSLTVANSAVLTIGDIHRQDYVDSGGAWQVTAGAAVVFDAQGTFWGGSVTGPGRITQGRVAFTFHYATTFSSLIAAGSFSGPATIGRLTARNVYVETNGVNPGSTMITLTGVSSITGLSVSDGAVVTNTGRLTVHRSKPVVFQTGGELVNAGSMTISGAGTAAVTGDGSTGSGLVLNSGSTATANLATSAASLTVSAPVTNNGTLHVRKGTFALTGPVSNLSGGLLSGGTWWADGGTLGLPSALTGNDATIILAATPNSAVTIAGSGTSALASLAANSGNLTLAQQVVFNQSLVTKGVLTIAATVHLPGFAQTGGTVTLTGDLFSSSPVSVTDGTFTGTGKVDGSLNNAGGTIAPGLDNVGTLSINGNLSQTSGSIRVTVTKSELDVSGNASLGGTLALRTPVPHPAPGTVANPIVTVGTVSGHFASVTGRAVAGTGTWRVTYGASAVTCTLAA